VRLDRAASGAATILPVETKDCPPRPIRTVEEYLYHCLVAQQSWEEALSATEASGAIRSMKVLGGGTILFSVDAADHAYQRGYA